MKIRLYHRYMRWRLLGFARVLFWSDKFQQRFSTAGMALLSVLVLTMMFGANTKQSMIYQMFALLLVLLFMALLVNMTLVWFKKKQFSIQRQLPAFATVNVPMTYTIQLHNQGEGDVDGLRVGERMAVQLPSLSRFLAAHEPFEEQRNWYDRKTGFYRFVWLQKWLRGGEFQTQVVQHIAGKQSYSLTMQLTPIRRGWVHFSRLRLALPEPFGLIYRFETHEQHQSLLVLPKRYTIPQHISLAGGRKYQQGGIAQASAVGDAEEFHGLREYRAGDSPRHIHWASLARGGKPLIKEYQDEHFSRQALVLDSFADVSKVESFEEAVSLAAGFAAGVEHDDCLLDLMFIHAENAQVEQLTFGRALGHPEQMLQALASVGLSADVEAEESSKAKFQDLADVVLQQSESFAACVLIFIAWDTVRQDFVRQLLAQGMVLRVFLLVESNDTSVYASVAGLESRFHLVQVGQVQPTLDNLDGI